MSRSLGKIVEKTREEDFWVNVSVKGSSGGCVDHVATVYIGCEGRGNICVGEGEWDGEGGF